MKTKLNGLLALFLALVVQITFAQEKTISGTVTDQDGLPLPGVNIVVMGTTNGTQTDFDGKYSITGDVDQVLLFSFLGQKDVRRTIGASTTVNIQMEEDAQALEEVIVTAVGIERESSSLGSSTTTLDNEDLVKGSQNNLADALKGKVAGVTISNASTDPGASSGVIIRGFSSLSGSNQPLYVIDGVPLNNSSTFDNSLNGGYDFGRGSGDVNPEDIESITVLKGASGTALYGSRAANGAIIITTKKGKSSKLTLEFSNTSNFTDVLRAPKYQETFGQGWDGAHYLGENGSWGPRFDDSLILWGNEVDNSQKIKPYTLQEDQLRNFFDNGTSFINNVAISGGSGETTGRLSFSNSNIDGVYPTEVDSYERNTIALSLNSKVDFLTFGGTVNYVSSLGSGVITGQGLSVLNNLMQIPTDIDITEFKDYKNDPFNNVSNYYTPYGVTNPYFTLNEDGADYGKERVYGSFNVVADLNDWSNISYRFGLDSASENIKLWRAIVDADPGSPNDGSSTEQPGSYAEIANIEKQINHDLFYNLDLDINEKLNVQSNFGLNYNDRYNSGIIASVSTQDIPGFYGFSNSASTPAVTSTITKRRLIGLLNSTTVSFNDMLYFTGNIRNDWYSTLPTQNRSILYGGVNTSWVFSRMLPGIENVLNYGKLRLGYGETGVDTDAYQILPVFVAGNTDNQGFRNLAFPSGGLNAFEVGNRAENSNLQPERRKEFEIGTNLSFFKNRITIDFTYYDAKVENQILSLPLAASSGFTNQTANIGTISNKGYEGLIDLAIIRNPEGFNWNASLNYSTNDAILEKLDDRIDQVDLGGLSTTSLIAREGEPLALLEGSVPETDPQGNIVVDNNGVPIADPTKEVYGNTQYDYTLGVSSDFSFKGITFGFTVDSRQGGLMFSRTADITRFTGNSITTTENDRQPWVVPNSVVKITDEVTGEATYEENTTPIDTEHMDDYYRATANDRSTVIDKSFVKLREVTLGYTLPSSIIDNTPFSSISFTLIGRNLFLWTPASNQYIDPEVSTFGTDLRSTFGEFSANPSTRSLGLTVKAKF